jgi:hypothetical protein
VLAGIFLLIGAAIVLLSLRLGKKKNMPSNQVGEAIVSTYVGAKTCKDHQLAMQVATAMTVLGDFQNVRFTDGLTSRFFTKDGKLYVDTNGPDGKLQEYEIKYTFGVYPLQQYLIPFPDGRLQALSIAWGRIFTNFTVFPLEKDRSGSGWCKSRSPPGSKAPLRPESASSTSAGSCCSEQRWSTAC